MANELNSAPKKEKKKSKLILRLVIPMLLLVLLQLVTFFAILILGGEFSYVRQYSYDTLAEKTENRKNYIQNEFLMKIPFVQESSDKINALISDVIAEQNASIADIKTNRELNRIIMESSVDEMVTLLRRSTANDVYLILDTGSLYSSDGGSENAKAALYLRDLDTTTDAGFGDLLMETGFSSISQSFGIVLDSGWTLHFEPDPNDMSNYDFYYKTIQTAQTNINIGRENLGYWSGFSKLSGKSSAGPSMKYSVPLISEDGTVYGIMGIGMTENTVLSKIPSNDFMSEIACYVLCKGESTEQFEIVTHSGAAFYRLVGNENLLPVSRKLEENIWDFELSGDIDLAGSVKYMNLYNANSPFNSERWALVSVADRSTVLSPLTNLVKMLIISAIVSLIVSIVVLIISSREIVKPITGAIKTMNSKSEFSEVISFQPSGIYELDKMTDAITQLQINVQDYSSQVSQMIRIANVGIGTFMYDRTDDSVFVGQSLLRLLKFKTQQEEDIMMSRQEFIENILSEETRLAITESLDVISDEMQDDYTREYGIVLKDGSVVWMRLTLVQKNNKSIGILQDITGAMMEKKRIEFERDYDGTTGLLNRHAYYNRIEKLFHNTDSLKVTAFIMIDLDNLKYVNDTYGHDFGDDYIKTAANALKKFQPHGGIVSRLSGDEFNICLPGFSSKEEIRQIIDDVRTQMLQSYCLLADGTHFKVRASMGISWYPDDSRSYEMLIKYADFAMYTIKHSTKGEYAEFSKSAYDKDSVLITGVEEMNRIIDECSVQYAFQSIISAKTGEVYGYEALMRPQSAIFQSPLELLRIAKTGAKLYEIEHMTWKKALADFQTQINAGRVSKDHHIFINSISDCVMESADADELENTYHDLIHNVVLEVLESESVNEDYTERKLRRMKKWNAQVALDDFGTGYNSEYALITLKPDMIKIDRSIISGCDKDMSRRTIISSLIKLARTKNILVLAEGVETAEELKTVISCGVDLLQGYYLDRPLFEPQPLAPEVTEMIKNMSGSADDYIVI